MAIEGEVVKYKRNGAVIYTSTQAPQYPLLADTSLYSTGATIQNAVICGNLQSSGLNSPPIPRDGLSSVSYDGTSNRITTSGYAYDAAGNQISVVHADSSVQKYQYDAANRMVKVRNANGVVLATYTYGASNQRLIAQAGDEQSSYRTYYAWGGDAVVAEYSETPSQPTSPQWTKSYVYLGSRLLATLTPSGASSELIQYHHPDRLGTRLVTNAQDTNSFEQVTLPFGTALDAESSGATNRRFTSYDRSSVTGLDYAVNRHYDAQQGRFTTVDPIGAGASSLADPQSWNLYAYCGNDPVNSIDPDGLFSLKNLFRSVGRIVATVLKWAAAVVAVAAVFIGIVLGNPAALVLGGLLFAVAFGGATVQRILGAANSFASFRGLARSGPGGTPVWNPQAGTGLGGGSGAVSQYINHYEDDEIYDPGEVVRININACKNGNKYPHCGAGWWGLVPIVGPAWDAHDAFRSGRWVWGSIYTAMAISDIFLVKAAVTSGGRLLVRGGEKIIVRHYTDDIGRAAISRSGALRADTFVTLPSEIPAGAQQIERLLEIQPGRGANFIDVATGTSNLRIPANGIRTSGGALQYQLNRRVRINQRNFHP